METRALEERRGRERPLVLGAPFVEAAADSMGRDGGENGSSLSEN